MQRPAFPPNIVSAGDVWSRDVLVYFKGQPDDASRWTYVDVTKGYGIRVMLDEFGKPQRAADGEHFLTEHVHGVFRLEWRQEVRT